MNSNTARNHHDRLLTRLRDCISEHFSHDTILEMVTRKVINDPAWKKCPSWVRESISARWSERIDAAYRWGALVWCHEWEGKRYYGWDKLPAKAKQAGRDQKLVSYHHWKSTGVRFS